jgi:hypothetical protein
VNQSLFNFNQSQSIKILGMESANKDALSDDEEEMISHNYEWTRKPIRLNASSECFHNLKCNRK